MRLNRDVLVRVASRNFGEHRAAVGKEFHWVGRRRGCTLTVATYLRANDAVDLFTHFKRR